MQRLGNVALALTLGGASGPASASASPDAAASPAPTWADPEDEEDWEDDDPPPAGPVRIRGTLLEAGQRTPLELATVIAFPAAPDSKLGRVRKTDYSAQAMPVWQRKTETDEQGRFVLRGVPDGRLRIIVLAPGFERLEYIEQLGADQTLTLRYFIPRASDNPFRTVVPAEPIREEVARRTITAQEITSLPGTQGDALKAIQNFPGVARAPFGIGLLVIRGADPSDSAVYLGHHEIPQLFHFGGITSVFNADTITQIDYLAGNFDARYGDAIGGIIDVTARPGRRDGVHGYVDTDLFDTGVFVEGPLGKGSYVLSGRRSYIDLLLPALLPDDAGLDAAIAPRYYDYQALFDYPVSRGTLSAKVFGSDDRTRLVFAGPNESETDDSDQFETVIFFHRVDLAYENHRRGWDFLITPSYRHQRFSGQAGALFQFRAGSDLFSGRVELGRKVTKRLRWDIGTTLIAGVGLIEAQAPPAPQSDEVGSTGTRLATDFRRAFVSPAVFGTLSYRLADRLSLYPGVNFTYFDIPARRGTVDPRLRFVWDITDRDKIKGGVGRYSQIGDILERNPVWGNPNLAPERALHTSLAYAREFDYSITLEVAAFYKYLWDLATPSSAIIERNTGVFGPESFATQGEGQIYGGRSVCPQRAHIQSVRLGFVHPLPEPAAPYSGRRHGALRPRPDPHPDPHWRIQVSSQLAAGCPVSVCVRQSLHACHFVGVRRTNWRVPPGARRNKLGSGGALPPA